MKNIQMSLRKLFRNKNTVTILGVVAVIAILFIGYKIQVNNAVSPVPNIPTASATIQPRTKITADMITSIDMASAAVPENVYVTSNAVIGKYSNYNTIIPKGSMFYKESLITEEELPDSAFVEVPKGKIPYNFPVTIDTTYGNSIFPGNYIDIYMKAENENGQIMVGKLIENVKVLAVKDSQGQHVFENSEETREPAYLIFALDAQMNILVRKASYLASFQVELFPVPHGEKANTGSNTTEVSSQTLQEFINAKTVPNDEIKAEEEAKAAEEAAKKAKEKAADTDKTTVED
ncbi:MAG: RcpC/CpaB family pilus assembly protein [Bacilli bacterium]|nr:RcpC/CpaB family pilus assembly protein [Bacilli bacterium]